MSQVSYYAILAVNCIWLWVVQVLAGSLLAGILISANLLVLVIYLGSDHQFCCLTVFCTLPSTWISSFKFKVSRLFCLTRVDVDCDIEFLGVHSDFRENKLATMLSLPD